LLRTGHDHFALSDPSAIWATRQLKIETIVQTAWQLFVWEKIDNRWRISSLIFGDALPARVTYKVPVACAIGNGRANLVGRSLPHGH
jgi:hypothetical protein